MSQYIDIEMALEQLEGSDRLYKTVVRGFYERYSQVDQQIEALLKEKDIEGARRIAHNLKGLSGNLGSLALKEKALDLEMSIRDGREDRETCLRNFSQTLAAVIDEASIILKERYGFEESHVPKESEEEPEPN